MKVNKKVILEIFLVLFVATSGYISLTAYTEMKRSNSYVNAYYNCISIGEKIATNKEVSMGDMYNYFLLNSVYENIPLWKKTGNEERDVNSSGNSYDGMNLIRVNYDGGVCSIIFGSKRDEDVKITNVFSSVDSNMQDGKMLKFSENGEIFEQRFDSFISNNMKK